MGLARGGRSGESSAAMKILLLLPLLLSAAACALPEPEYRRVSALRYEAFGEDPRWQATIDDKTAALVIHDPALGPTSTSHGAVSARTHGTTTRWTAGGGLGGFTVEARRDECVAADGVRYEDTVTVSLSGRQLHGCGGNRLMGRRG